MAEFWSDDIVGLSFSPPARLFAIANQIIVIENIDLETTLHLYCKLGIAENDSAVAAWKAKYEYNVERPFHYIRKYINSEFRPLLGEAIGVPGLTPSSPLSFGSLNFWWPGQHNLICFYWVKTIILRIDAMREGMNLMVPHEAIAALVNLVKKMLSRICLGVHPRFDCTEGLRLGKQIANNVLNYELKKIKHKFA